MSIVAGAPLVAIGTLYSGLPAGDDISRTFLTAT